ncbi:MAG TPA: hypothetical protein VH442_04665 [Micromonosporaceae bacterium]
MSDLRGQPLHSGDGGLVAAADLETHAVLLSMLRDQRSSKDR